MAFLGKVYEEQTRAGLEKGELKTGSSLREAKRALLSVQRLNSEARKMESISQQIKVTEHGLFIPEKGQNLRLDRPGPQQCPLSPHTLPCGLMERTPPGELCLSFSFAHSPFPLPPLAFSH